MFPLRDHPARIAFGERAGRGRHRQQDRRGRNRRDRAADQRPRPPHQHVDDQRPRRRPDPPAREGVEERQGEQRHRGGPQHPGDPRVPRTAGKMHTEHRPDAGKDPQRIPVGEWIPEPLLTDQRRVEDGVWEEPGDQRRCADRGGGNRDPIHHPTNPTDVEWQHAEEEQRQPVEQRARILGQRPAHRMRPVRGEQRPATEAGQRYCHDDKGFAGSLQGPPCQRKAQPDHQRHLGRGEARSADIEPSAAEAQEDRQSARQEHDEDPAGLLEALAPIRITTRFARHRINNDLGEDFVRPKHSTEAPAHRERFRGWKQDPY